MAGCCVVAVIYSVELSDTVSVSDRLNEACSHQILAA